MVAQVALLGFGPAGWVAFAAVTLILFAGASGAFDQKDVEDNDYDEDGIYVPGPDPVVDPNVDDDDYEYVRPDPEIEKQKEKELLVLPYSYVCVYMSQGGGDDYDPDIPDDIRPPSSSFTVAGEAYDSGIGLYIAAIMAFFLTYWGMRNLIGGRS